MKNWKILEWILCLLIMASCTKTEKPPVLEKGIAVISGKISNLGEDSKAIRLAALSTIENIEKTAIIDSTGNFNIEVELYHPQNVQVFFKDAVIKLYLHPLDSIHLEIDENLFTNEKYPDFQISGISHDSDISKEIQQYLKYCGENEFYPDASGKSVKEFLQVLQKEINRQDSILRKYSKEHKSSEEFNNWAKKDIRYSVANYLLNYKFANQNYKGDLFDKSVFPINDDDAIISSLYPLHLRHYALNIGIWKDSVTLNYLKENNYVAAYQRCMGTIIDSVKGGLSRDLMCYMLLSGLLEESYKDYGIVSQKIDSYIENETLKDILHDKENDYKNQKMLDISFFDPVTKEEKQISGDFWKEIKEKYHGKVVYIDIWATWCAPCRGEIPHAIEVHDYFNGKDIAFINLCLASNEYEWQNMIKSNNIKGNNYFFNKAQTQLFRDKLQFDGYPTYLIIDKNGNLVDKNAPRPSSGEKIKQVLNDWIEKDTP